MSSASKRKQLQQEIEALKLNYANTPLQKINWDEDERSLSLRVSPTEGKNIRINFYVPEDFPDMRPMASLETEKQEKELDNIVNKVNDFADKPKSTITDIVNFLMKEFGNLYKFDASSKEASPAPAPAPSTNRENMKKSGNLKRSMKSSGNWKNESGEISGGEDEDFDEDFGAELQSEATDDTRFVRHCKQVQLVYGEKSVMVYPFIDTVRFLLDTSSVGPALQKLLGIEKANQVVISVQFTSGYLDDRTAPKVKAIHPMVNDTVVKVGLAEQLENIAILWLERKWPLVNVKKDAKEHPVHKLTTLGYEKEFSEMALEKSYYKYEDAINWLSENIENLRLQSGKSEKKETTTTPTKKKSVIVASPKSTKLTIKGMLDKGYTQLAIASALSKHSMNVEKAMEEILNNGGFIEGYQTLLTHPVDKENFVLEMITYLIHRLNEIMGHCLICDDKIYVQGYEGFDIHATPIICTKGTCQFNYLELGVCESIPIAICPSSLSDDIKNNADVVDLLISMCVASATSTRRDAIFEPFPPEFKASNGTNDFVAVEKVLGLIPSVAEMEKNCDSESQLISFLTKADPSSSVYRLLRWILTVNRSCMLKIPPKNQIAEMKTQYQYMMMAGHDPTVTAQFKENRKKYGSYFAFHGSGIENWHSILRRGLLNCSGTKLMTTGQAYGAGVYLAPDCGTSFGYARTGKAWSKSRFGNSANLVCLAIAEVVKYPGVPTTPNPYFVIPQAEHVATRFFLFYAGGGSGVNLQASTLNLHKYVQ